MVSTPAPRAVVRDLSAFYFFTFGGLGGILPFLPILLAVRGLSPSEVGWVMLLGPVANLVAPPLWGWLADAFSARLVLLRLTGLGCAAGALMLLGGTSFVWSLGAMAVYSAFRAPILPLADTAAHTALGKEVHRFADIRVWGSLGFALFAFSIGHFDGTSKPTLMLGLTAGAYLMSTASTARLSSPPLQPKTPVAKAALQFVMQPRLLALFVGSAFYYVAHGAFDVYFGLHMRALGHSDSFVGLAWMVAVFAEVGLMRIAPRLLRYRSGEGYLVLAACASVLRWLLLSQIESQIAILFSQLLHALTFGIWYLALVRYIQVRAPTEVRTTVQSVSQAAQGFGMMVGYLGGGQVFEAFGGGPLFGGAAIAAGCAGLLYGALWALRGSGAPGAPV